VLPSEITGNPEVDPRPDHFRIGHKASTTAFLVGRLFLCASNQRNLSGFIAQFPCFSAGRLVGDLHFPQSKEYDKIRLAKSDGHARQGDHSPVLYLADATFGAA